LTLLLALTGAAFTFRSAYGLGGEAKPLLELCLLLAALSTALWSLPRGGYAVAGTAMAAELLAAWRLRAILAPPMEDLGGRFLALWNALTTQGVGQGADAVKAGTLTGEGWRIAAVMLCIWLALVLGWAVVRAGKWWLTLGLTVLPVLPALLAGAELDWWALMAAVAGSLALLLGAYRPAARLTGLLASVLLLTALTLAVPQESYTYPQWARDARQNLEDLANDLAQRLELEGAGTGAAVSTATIAADGEVDLTTMGPRRYNGRTILQLEGEGSGRLYLRGNSSATYTGDAWTGEDEEAVYELFEQGCAGTLIWPLLYPAWTNATAYERTLTVRCTSADAGVAYAPYQLTQAPGGGVTTRADVGLTQEGVQTYVLSYRDLEDLGTPGTVNYTWSQAETMYQAFVYQQYLDVPEEASQALAPLVDELYQQLGDIPYTTETAYRLAAAQIAAALLADAAVYDLATPAKDDGEDFVAHFLEQGRGYCVHFATAGTLLLRRCGVPARYVEGYVADLDDTGSATVRDYDAHAWVEIYLDGYGWYPVEMTPSASTAETDTETDDTPEALNRDLPAAADDTPDQPQASQGETAAQAAETSHGAATVVLIVLAALAVVLLPGIIVRARRRRAQKASDTGRSAVGAYRWGKSLARFGGKLPEELEALAGKAVFSQHILTEEERQKAWSLALDEAEDLRKTLPLWRRLGLHWLGLLDRFSSIGGKFSEKE
jgi:transglutaminase-like putative cysteine protease